MSKFIVIILVVAFFVSVGRVIYNKAQGHADVEVTNARFKSKLINIGDKVFKSSAEGKFTIYNTGLNDLIIKSVEPDCHCTGAIFAKKAIKPNDSSEIILKYNSSIPGIFQSSATVTTNTPDSLNILIFRGNIVDTTKRK